MPSTPNCTEYENTIHTVNDPPDAGCFCIGGIILVVLFTFSWVSESFSGRGLILFSKAAGQSLHISAKGLVIKNHGQQIYKVGAITVRPMNV